MAAKEKQHTIVVHMDRKLHDEFRDEMARKGLAVGPGVRLLISQWLDHKETLKA